MLKLFPSQYYFDRKMENRYVEWIFKKTRLFVAAIGLLVVSLITTITIANIYISGYELVSRTVLCIRIIVFIINFATIISFIWLSAHTARNVLFASTIILSLMAFLDTYNWVGQIGYFSPEAQMITMYMFMIIPFLNVEHKVVTGILIILGLIICKYLLKVDVFWSMLYCIMMYATNIVVYYIFDILLRAQFKTICTEQSRSNTDILTGVYNKNALHTFFPDDVKSIAHNEKMIVGLLDIDCFKNYNDTYGHVAGDKVLKQIAQALQSLGFDKVYRFGGEEFIFTIIRNKQNTSNIPNVCGILENLNIPHDSSAVSPFVTASLGIINIMRVTRKKHLTTDYLMNRIIHEADANLYKAKSLGRNQTVTSKKTIRV